MFEKISPPVHRVAQAIALKEPRGVIVQMLDRIAESRLQREARALRRSQHAIGYTEADITPTRTRF
jgi:hypothetical protein